jgi:hypothetical protein
MTPQEKDLITSLLGRLRQQAGQPRDQEADALIRQAMTAQPDAPYFLIQTVLIQDMALNEAHNRIKELEDQLAGANTAPGQAPASFLGAARGSVPSAGGPWGRAPAPASQPSGPAWTQSGAGQAAAAPSYGAPGYAPPAMAPLAAPGASSGFLRQAAATAAGIAGGALLFQGIQSMFGPHYGSGFLGGMPMQPGLSETVVNNYYGADPGAPGAAQADWSPDAGAGNNDPGMVQADDQDYSGQDYADNQDPGTDQDPGGDQDFGGGDGNFDV